MKRLFLLAIAGAMSLGLVASSCSSSGQHHIVTFDSRGGTAISSQNVPYGGYATRPANNPTRDGYDFAGWYHDTEANRAWDFANTQIFSAATIYAGWTLDAQTTDQRKVSLNAKIAEAEAAPRTDYDDAGWDLLQSMLTEAKRIRDLKEATDEQIQTALNELDTALDNKKSDVNKSTLIYALTTAGELSEGAYTAETWATLRAAIVNGETVNMNNKATQAEVDAALSQLSNAVKGLQLKPSEQATVADKSALAASITNANGKVQAEYTAETWSAMQTSLTNAKNVQADATATQTQVDAAKADLDRTIAALQHVQTSNAQADKTALNSFIADSEKLVEANYTADSWRVFQTYLIDAKAVKANSTATQSEVNQAYTNLETGVNQLALQQTDTGVVSGLVNQLTSLLNSLPSAEIIKSNPLLATVATPVATLADQVRDQLVKLTGGTNSQVNQLGTQLNGILTALNLDSLI